MYVFPYNGGYIFCECYAFKDRTIDTPFYDATQAARNDINDRVINQAFKESIAREKNKTFDDHSGRQRQEDGIPDLRNLPDGKEPG